MAADHFCLIWNNFQNSILSALGSLQDSQDLVDVTLMCEGQNVRAHKVILSACSPYFRNLFKETPCQHPVIILKDVSHYDLTALLQFMYQGEVLITQECLSSFLKTAELLQVSGLAGAAAAASSVVTNSSDGTPRVPPDNINPPDSPGTVINKLNSELSLRKAKNKNIDKEKSENKSSSKYSTETDPRQSCSYDIVEECITVKTEADDGDFEEMITEPSNLKHIEDQFDDTSTHSEEPSILERSLKAHSDVPFLTTWIMKNEDESFVTDDVTGKQKVSRRIDDDIDYTSQPRRKRRQCQIAQCNGNKTWNSCPFCKKPVCGRCSSRKHRQIKQNVCINCAVD